MTSLSCSIRSLPVPSPRLSAARIASSTIRISLDSVTTCPRVLRCVQPRSLSSPSMAVVVGTERKKDVEVFNTEEALATSIAEHTSCLSEKFVRARGAFSVVLSGGSLLSSSGAADDYETCLTHLAKSGVVASSERTGLPKFNLMLLGMGPDRRIASLFSGNPLVNEHKKWVAFIKDSPKPPRERITFTFPIINSSAYIAIVVAGFGKLVLSTLPWLRAKIPMGCLRKWFPQWESDLVSGQGF